LTSPFILSNAQARRLFLERQGLSASPRPKLSTDGLFDLIKTLGFVQVDSINTVARAHHMILFARNQTYRPAQLTQLLEYDRRLFEHWTHDAAVIPTDFYPYWQHRFIREKISLAERWHKWRREGFEDVLTAILEKVTNDGPTMTRDIASKKQKGTGWWDWHPEKTALEFHWRTGNLSISGRKGFQKVYDITEKVIPEIHRKGTVSEQAFIDWACRSALERLGVATPGEITAFWGLITSKEANGWCQAQLAKRNLIDVQVEPVGGARPGKALAFADLPDRLGDLPDPPKRVRVLSPFDPLIRDRKRCLRLFGFDYRIEVFVPQKNRRYGYYVFPLLEGSQFIGRIDMKQEKGILKVTGLWLEPGVKLGKRRKVALDAELERQRKFIGATKIVYAL